MKIPINGITNRGDLLLTTACPVECDHCLFSCTKKGEWMPEKTIRRVAEQFSKNGIGIRITGGEPFYDLKKLERCLDVLLEYFNQSSLWTLTSGFFATKKEITKKYLKMLKQRGLTQLLVSSDRWHLKYTPMSNLINILKVAKRNEIKVTLRMLLDEKSIPFIKEIVKVVVEYEPMFEFTSAVWVGRAQKKENKGFEKGFPQDIFLKEFHACNREKKRHLDINKLWIRIIDEDKLMNYWIPSFKDNPKYLRFSPTVFPSGNVYGCSMAVKGVYMGNINKIDLSKMVKSLKNTLAGNLLFREKYCYEFNHFTSPVHNHPCDLCQDQPFIESFLKNENYVGREYIEISTKNMKKVYEKYNGRELLIFFKLKESELNKEIGKKIFDFLNDLKYRGVLFSILNVLPKCLFGSSWPEVVKSFEIPKNCFECNGLFTVENNHLILCPNVYNLKDDKFDFVKNRLEIFEKFENRLEKIHVSSACKNCTYLKRKKCNGLCFRRLNE